MMLRRTGSTWVAQTLHDVYAGVIRDRVEVKLVGNSPFSIGKIKLYKIVIFQQLFLDTKIFFMTHLLF